MIKIICSDDLLTVVNNTGTFNLKTTHEQVVINVTKLKAQTWW